MSLNHPEFTKIHIQWNAPSRGIRKHDFVFANAMNARPYLLAEFVYYNYQLYINHLLLFLHLVSMAGIRDQSRLMLYFIFIYNPKAF